jgi:hypothetical protein
VIFNLVCLLYFFCGYDKRVTKLFCAVIQTCYFTVFNHRLGQPVSLFIVVLVLVDLEKKRVLCVCLCLCVQQQRVSEYL